MDLLYEKYSKSNESGIRILCLHGYRQDKYRFAKSAANLIKKCKQHQIELVIIDAPYEMQPHDRGYDVMLGNHQRKWFTFHKTNAITDDNQTYDTWKESVEYVKQIWTTTGPYDGILGFSQGSIIAQLFCKSMSFDTNIDNNKNVCCKMVILCNPIFIHDLHADKQTQKHHQEQLRKNHQYPHCFISVGDKDNLVPSLEWQAIEKSWPKNKNVHVERHPGGHYIASSSDSIKKLIEFIKKTSSML